MEAAKNIPYVKQFDENGTLTNPITVIYPQPFDNRRTRRFTEPRFLNNRKGIHLQQVGPNTVFRKVLQLVFKANPRKRTEEPTFSRVGEVKHFLRK